MGALLGLEGAEDAELDLILTRLLVLLGSFMLLLMLLLELGFLNSFSKKDFFDTSDGSDLGELSDALLPWMGGSVDLLLLFRDADMLESLVLGSIRDCVAGLMQEPDMINCRVISYILVTMLDQARSNVNEAGECSGKALPHVR